MAKEKRAHGSRAHARPPSVPTNRPTVHRRQMNINRAMETEIFCFYTLPPSSKTASTVHLCALFHRTVRDRPPPPPATRFRYSIGVRRRVRSVERWATQPPQQPPNTHIPFASVAAAATGLKGCQGDMPTGRAGSSAQSRAQSAKGEARQAGRQANTYNGSRGMNAQQ